MSPAAPVLQRRSPDAAQHSVPRPKRHPRAERQKVPEGKALPKSEQQPKPSLQSPQPSTSTQSGELRPGSRSLRAEKRPGAVSRQGCSLWGEVLKSWSHRRGYDLPTKPSPASSNRAPTTLHTAPNSGAALYEEESQSQQHCALKYLFRLGSASSNASIAKLPITFEPWFS